MRWQMPESASPAWAAVATGRRFFAGRTLSHTVVPQWLAKVRKQLGQSGDELQLRLMTGSIHDGAIALEQGGADFLLSFAHPRLALALDDQQFEALTLGHDELVAVNQPLPNGKPRHALPGTVAKPVNALSFAPQLALAQILQDSLTRARQELHLHVVTESDFAESLHEQALQGAGVAWLPLALVAEDLKAGRLMLAHQTGASHEPIRYEIRLYRPRHVRKPHLQKVWAASS